MQVEHAALPALRTPDACFEAVPDFPWTPRYHEDLPGYEGLRMHYLDVAPTGHSPTPRTFLCLHGEPSWSFLYRKMIPVFAKAGHRVIAPDWFGFGRSDKPTDLDAYTFTFHRNSLLAFIERMNLGDDLVLVVQDWGGILGLTLPMEMPDRIQGLVVMNTALATGDVPPGPGFEAWKQFVLSQEDLDVARLMRRAIPGLSKEEAAAYGAPFPTAEFKAGVRTFPAIVPVSPEMDGAALSRQARDFFRSTWKAPTMMAVGELDPVLGPPAMKHLAGLISGCPEPLMLPEAGHFVQEHGVPVAEGALDAFGLR